MAELTKETAQRMFNEAGQSIFICEKNADECANLLTILKSKPDTDALNALRGILDASLMLDFINLDLCAAYRQYLSTELSAKYDKRQAMTKINVVMSEGFKRIYGFEGDSRKSSYWINQIKTAVDFLGELDKEYKELEDELIVFANNGVLNKSIRDLAVHYDKDPMKIYKMLSDLSAEEVSKRCLDFYSLLYRIRNFLCQLSKAMLENLKSQSFSYGNDI